MSSDDVTAPLPPAGPDAIAAVPEAVPEPASQAERVSYLGFCLGPEVFGLPLEQLREVCKLTRLRRVPGAPSGVAGLVNLRGEIVCALNTRGILGLAAAPAARGEFLVALRGFPDPLGLVVDSITDVYAIDPAVIESPPDTWAAAPAALSLGTTAVPEGVMTLLDLRRMIEATP